MLTIDQLVALALKLGSARDISFDEVRTLAVGVIDLLAESAPCGWAAPEKIGPDQILTDWGDLGTLSDQDAGDIARLLLRARDEVG